MLVKSEKCYLTAGGHAVKVRVVKSYGDINVEVGWIRQNGEVNWEYHCDVKSLSGEVEIDWVEKEICNNYDVILKFLCGETIQYYNTATGEWIDVDPITTDVSYLNTRNLRVKKPMQYRLALMDVDRETFINAINSNPSFTNEEVAKEAESNVYFKKWISDWIEVE
jgi:hypothetical protein